MSGQAHGRDFSEEFELLSFFTFDVGAIKFVLS